MVSTPPLRSAAAFSAIHPFTLNTPSPATPELGWSASPATQLPLTPEIHFDPNDRIRLPGSPLAARTANLKTNAITSLNLSPLDSYVPEQLLSTLSSETSRNKRLFRNELSSRTLAATSQPQSPPSNDNHRTIPVPFFKIEIEERSWRRTSLQPLYPSGKLAGHCSDAVEQHATARSAPTVANDIKSEHRSVVSDERVAGESQTKIITTTTATTVLPQYSRRKKALTLSIVWTLNTKLTTILPLEAIERFDADPSHCIGTTEDGLRCNKTTTRSSNKGFVTKLFTALSTFQRSLDFESFAEHMAPLIESVTCTQWHGKRARSCLDELCSYSWQTREIAVTDPHQGEAITNIIDSVFKFWISALIRVPTIAKCSNVPAKGDADGVRGAPCSTIVFSDAAPYGNPAIFRHASLHVTAPSKNATNSHVTNKSTTGIPGTQMTVPKAMRLSTHLNHAFEPYPYSKAKANATPQALIRQTLKKPLTYSDMLRSGVIYVFWHPGSMGYVKIGYANNIKKRLEDWHKQCGFNLEQHKSREYMDVTKVQHLDRIEKLIHAELKEYRVFEPCCSGCGRKHLEWFQVDPSYALRVVAKWTRRSLYSEGELDPSISKEEIEKLCQLTEADRPLPLPRKGTKNFNGSIRGGGGGRRTSKPQGSR